jgi:hypothetical protein
VVIDAQACIGKYQGEVMHKRELQDRFSAKVSACKGRSDLAATGDWSGIELVLRMLFTAFHASDAALIRELAVAEYS